MESVQASVRSISILSLNPWFIKLMGRTFTNLPFRNGPENNFNVLDEVRKPTVSAIESSRRALAPGFSDLANQPGLAPSPARQQTQ